jgi:hypothetical protein
VLAVQDTTYLSGQPTVALGLGPLERPTQRGLFVHSTLAVTTAGVPLGLLAQQVWARDPAQVGQRHQRRQRPITAKESQKWLQALPAARAVVPAAIRLVHVGDREADVYDLFVAAATVPHTDVLIRATQDRRLSPPSEPAVYLWATLAAQPVADTRLVPLPRAEDRPARTARLTVRWAGLTLHPPQHRQAEGLPPVVVDAVLVQESDTPAGEEPIEWLLLTTVPVVDAATAWERVTWYTYRWRVERYHYVLKSGCRLEARRLETATRLESCLALYSVIACHLLRLTYQARATPLAPAAEMLAPAEWAVLWAARHPDHPRPAAPTVRTVVREIAGLGGFLGRRQDGEPGVQTLWRGLHRFYDLLLGYHLARLQLSEFVGNG